MPALDAGTGAGGAGCSLAAAGIGARSEVGRANVRHLAALPDPKCSFLAVPVPLVLCDEALLTCFPGMLSCCQGAKWLKMHLTFVAC
jgi:hypothetical protein